MQERSNVSKWIGIVIILIQLLDIIIHVVLNRPEPTRIVSNIVILGWIIIVLAGWLKEKFRPISFGAIGVYIVLNLVFILTPNILTTSELLFMLFVFVIPTVGLSAWFTLRASKSAG